MCWRGVGLPAARQAHLQAYRWGEDGLASFCDVEQRLRLGLAWNGRDPILKERAFGLTGAQANHGEDVKEYWWFLDAAPSHAWNRWRYHYPQAAFPYEVCGRKMAGAASTTRSMSCSTPACSTMIATGSPRSGTPATPGRGTPTRSVLVCLFDRDGAETQIPLLDCDAGVWHGFVPRAGAGQAYGYRAAGRSPGALYVREPGPPCLRPGGSSGHRHRAGTAGYHPAAAHRGGPPLRPGPASLWTVRTFHRRCRVGVQAGHSSVRCSCGVGELSGVRRYPATFRTEEMTNENRPLPAPQFPPPPQVPQVPQVLVVNPAAGRGSGWFCLVGGGRCSRAGGGGHRLSSSWGGISGAGGREVAAAAVGGGRRGCGGPGAGGGGADGVRAVLARCPAVPRLVRAEPGAVGAGPGAGRSRDLDVEDHNRRRGDPARHVGVPASGRGVPGHHDPGRGHHFRRSVPGRLDRGELPAPAADPGVRAPAHPVGGFLRPPPPR